MRAFGVCAALLATLDVRAYASLLADKGLAGGAWSWCTHLARYGLNFDLGLASFLAHQLKPNSSLEFGSGIGIYSKYLVDHGKVSGRVFGMEPESMHAAGAFVKSGWPQQLEGDVLGGTKEEKQALGTFDLVFSIEVAEHLATDLIPTMVEFLVSKTDKYLVFGAARPKQGGTGHVPGSMKTRQQWIKIFEDAGMVYLPQLSTMLLSQCDDINQNHKVNPFVMGKMKSPDSPFPSTSMVRSVHGMRGEDREQYTYTLFPAVAEAVKIATGCHPRHPPK